MLPIDALTGLPELIWARVAPGPGGCWVWSGGRSHDGYGRQSGRTVHKEIYRALVGPIALGLQLDHLCRRRDCCNPLHLEPVTKRENGRRGLRGDLTTHCAKGHEYSADNTYVHVRSDGFRRRSCRACNRIAQQRLRAPEASP